MLTTGWDFLYASAATVIAAFVIARNLPSMHVYMRAKSAASHLRLQDRGLVKATPYECTSYHNPCGSRVRTAIDSAGNPQRFCPTCVCLLDSNNRDPRFAVQASAQPKLEDPNVVSMVGRKPKYLLKKPGTPDTVA